MKIVKFEITAKQREANPVIDEFGAACQTYSIYKIADRDNVNKTVTFFWRVAAEKREVLVELLQGMLDKNDIISFQFKEVEEELTVAESQ